MFVRRAQPEQDPRPARLQFGEAMRQLASGLITNDAFDLRYAGLTEKHREIYELYDFAWSFYDDLSPHRMRGRHRLSKLQRQVFARCVLFLRSGLPYEYPSDAKWLWARQRRSTTNLWNQILIAGYSRNARDLQRRREREDERLVQSELIDDRIWPFRSRADLEFAKKHCRLLAA